MTFRARPTTRAGRRRGLDSDARRNLIFNLGFGGVVVVAILLLVGAAAAAWYGEHLAPVAVVNGETITRDGLRHRAAIEMFRLDTLESRTRDKVAAGRMPPAQGQQLINFIAQQRQGIADFALEREIDATLLLQLAAREGVEISEAAIDAQIREDATAPESRHTFMIRVVPEVSEGATEPTAEQVAAARQKAEDLRAQLEAGTSWEEVVQASGDTDAIETNGDLSFLDEGSVAPDQYFVEAIFALPAPGFTDVIEGADGIFRIGRLAEIVPEVHDPNYLRRAADAGISEATYRRFAAAVVARDALEERLLAEIVDAPSEQRRVGEIVIDANDGLPLAEGAVLVRHLLFAPADDPGAAAALEADDPAWQAAEEEALRAHADLEAGTVRFVDLAPGSDDATSAARNGFLPYFAPNDPGAQLDPAFAAAIFADGLEEGQLLEPVKSAFGWHVIQLVSRDAPTERAASLAAEASRPGADFAALAAEHSIAGTAAGGGELGWIARYQLDQERHEAIFATQEGDVSEILPRDGFTFYKVLEVAIRSPDPAQAAQLRAVAFTNWFTGIKEDPEQTTIERILGS
jgi:parvulin-like peptidyl-prolyl isomerase